MGHASGMIGFPLRLLARENYDRVVRAKGADAVALLTGEERILPARPRYFICTVESMPVDRAVAFLAIDEIQLAADPERGHIFTERLLHARGLVETMVLGADTIRPLVRRLVPEAEFLARPRLSNLSYSGPRKLSRLPPRAVVVAFSAGEVYGLAEYLRRQRGGAAVVLGALSPRTRNAQVGLFQNGEVDVLVATDAIGMGLNMDVDHVAFAGFAKFDGRGRRPLAPNEIAQIAGRAGRGMRDGTFGVTADCPCFGNDLVRAVENHTFPPLTRLMWRNTELRFTSPEALIASLERAPLRVGLARAPEAIDLILLRRLSAEQRVRARLTDPGRLKRLWEVCRIPDFRKGLDDGHAKLLADVFIHLTEGDERLPADWLAGQIRRLDRAEGDLDTLMGRIASIRIWTYVSHRADWLADAAHWQDTTRAVEDRLSDALHERLSQRFIDRRTAHLVRRLHEDNGLTGTVEDGAISVEGHVLGRLSGLAFVPVAADSRTGTKAVLAAAEKAVRPEVGARVQRIAEAADDAFALADDGGIFWNQEPVAQLTTGRDRWMPQAAVAASAYLDPADREQVRRSAEAFARAHIAHGLAALTRLRGYPWEGAARGLVHQVTEGLGGTATGTAQAQLTALTAEQRRKLGGFGLRFGTESVYLPSLLKPAAQRLRAILWATARDQGFLAPPGGRGCIPAQAPEEYYNAIGYLVRGGLAIRADLLERFAALVRRHPRRANPSGEMLSLLGLTEEAASALITALRRGR